MKANLLKIELIKLRRRSAFSLAVSIFGGFVIVMLAGMAYATTQGGMTIRLPGFWNEAHQFGRQLIPFFAWITVVNLVAAEYAWKTSRQNVIDGLSREQWFVAKALTVPFSALLFWALLWTLMLIGGIAMAESREQLMTADQLRALLALLLVSLGFSAAGLLASFITRHTAGAIAVVIGWQALGEGLVQLGLYRINPEYMKYSQYLPFKNLDSLANLQRWVPGGAVRSGVMSVQSAPLLSNQAAVLLALVYIGIFMAASFALVRRQDL